MVEQLTLLRRGLRVAKRKNRQRREGENKGVLNGVELQFTEFSELVHADYDIADRDFCRIRLLLAIVFQNYAFIYYRIWENTRAICLSRAKGVFLILLQITSE